MRIYFNNFGFDIVFLIIFGSDIALILVAECVLQDNRKR